MVPLGFSWKTQGVYKPLKFGEDQTPNITISLAGSNWNFSSVHSSFQQDSMLEFLKSLCMHISGVNDIYLREAKFRYGNPHSVALFLPWYPCSIFSSSYNSKHHSPRPQVNKIVVNSWAPAMLGYMRAMVTTFRGSAIYVWSSSSVASFYKCSKSIWILTGFSCYPEPSNGCRSSPELIIVFWRRVSRK